MTKKARMDAPLDFLRSLRIKNAIENPMSRTLFRISLPAFAIGLLFLVTGCGEDPRFSARTQYLGGVYGNAEGGPPRDTVSYWDGDNAGGSPSVKISLGEQRAYFYKSGVLVGVSQLSTGREGLNTPLGHYKIIQKDKDHVSSLFGDYVDSAGTVVVPMSILIRIRNLQALISEARPCRTSCGSCPERVCMQVIRQVIRRRTVVC